MITFNHEGEGRRYIKSMLRCIYRIEGLDGIGPYGGCSVGFNVDDNGDLDRIAMAHVENEHPCLSEDFDGFEIDTYWYSGFYKLGDLYNWFKGWFGVLEEAGYRIVEYRVPEEWIRVGSSGLQVIFNREIAGVRVVRSRKISNFLKMGKKRIFSNRN